MIKKILSVVMAIAVLFAICACNGNSDLLKKVEELESTVQSQSEKITELESKNKQQSDKLSEFEGKNKEQAGKVSELEEQNKHLLEQLADLEKQSKQHADRIGELEEQNIQQLAKFYSLREAYNNRWLTSDDIMNIGYYYGQLLPGLKGGLTEEELVGFEPKPIEPTELDEVTETRIKIVHRRDFIEDLSASLDKIYIEYYYGTYNDCVVVYVYDDYVIGCDPIRIDEYELGGVTILNYYPAYIQVYHE